jgi:signal transduction histidine kinase
MKMNFELADVRATISAVVALFQQQARQKGLSLSVELPVRLPRVLLDTERFEQVLVNLIGNALKFTPEGCIRVGVRSRTEPPALEITVRDTGVGIAPEEQAKIFDEFAQVRYQAAHRQREGSGLGLAIAKRIVEAHEGQISVSSTPGKGSTFTVTLPLRKRRPSPRNAVSA